MSQKPVVGVCTNPRTTDAHRCNNNTSNKSLAGGSSRASAEASLPITPSPITIIGSTPAVTAVAAAAASATAPDDNNKDLYLRKLSPKLADHFKRE